MRAYVARLNVYVYEYLHYVGAKQAAELFLKEVHPYLAPQSFASQTAFLTPIG